MLCLHSLVAPIMKLTGNLKSYGDMDLDCNVKGERLVSQ